MISVCVMLKSYREDLAYVHRLVGSFERFNHEELTLFIVVPAADTELFASFNSSTVIVMADEEIPIKHLSKSEAEAPEGGFINAGASKLGFWELGICENYFAIDSDMVFIRPFGAADFLSEDGHPFITATEAFDLKSDPFYFERYWDHRESSLNLIHQLLGVDQSRKASYHTVQVMNSDVLRAFKEKFLGVSGLEYVDILSTSLWEFFWYTSWALNQDYAPVCRRDEIVKVVHHQGQHLALRNLGISQASLARSYLGVIVNSNWSRQYGLVDFDSPPSESYLKSGAWAEWRKSMSAPVDR